MQPPVAMALDRISIDLERARLGAALTVPPGARVLVLFAHAAGRLGPRNRHVARGLEDRGIATLLLDLLTTEEARIAATDSRRGIDVDFLAERLIRVTDWARCDPRTAHLPQCYFGARASAAVALIAAARRPDEIVAVVSRTGRPDLARAALAAVRAPTLLIVGSGDPEALRINRAALQLLAATARLAIAPGASRVFSDPGALDVVAQLAADWLFDHLAAAADRRPRPELVARIEASGAEVH